MPLLKRQAFKRNPDPDFLKDNEEVFFCEATKEIFRNYEQYFERIMLVNSMVWTCAMTGKPGLTYSEAIEHEKKAKREIKDFPKTLIGPLILIGSHVKRIYITDFVDAVFGYVRDRYFKNEEVESFCETSKIKTYRPGKVIEVICNEPISKTKLYEPKDLTYRIKSADPKTEPQEWVTSIEHIRRVKLTFSKDRLKLLMKQVVESNNGKLVIKPNEFKTYVTDANVKNEDVFVGQVPDFVDVKKSPVLTNGKDTSKSKPKQTSMAKYLTKDDGAEPKKQTKRQEVVGNSKKLKDEMERKKLEAVEKQKKMAEEKEKEKIDLKNKIAAALKDFNQTRDDLELVDQRPIPIAKPINMLIANRHLGDFFNIVEFMNTFADVLSVRDKFRNGFTIDDLERAFLLKEVNGPLSDLLQVLLSTIFSLQNEEENEVFISQPVVGKQYLLLEEPDRSKWYATQAARYSEKHFGVKLPDLPMDATTLSELLRLHLLSSGCFINNLGAKWRFQNRGGFEGSDDPGLLFRFRYPHILRGLSLYDVFQLPLNDIIKIIKCLMDQILTFSSVRDIVEERLDNAYKARIAIKTILTHERKRTMKYNETKRDLAEDKKAKLLALIGGTKEERAKQTEAIEEKYEKSIKKIEEDNERSKAKYNTEMLKETQQNFDYQLYLGQDRAYRSYYLFESVPGLFVEHDIELSGRCLDEFVKNITGVSKVTNASERYHFIKQLQTNNQNGSDKENQINNVLEITKVNGGTAVDLPDIKDSLTEQQELMMCTANSSNCPVHSEKYPNRVRWSYYSTEEEINSLIDSLNSRGIREKILLEKLTLEKELILRHIKMCPSDKLSIVLSEKDSIVEKMYATNTLKNNFDFPPKTELAFIMNAMVREYVLEFEEKVRKGYLGTLKVDNLDHWRQSIAEGSFSQESKEIKYGQFRESNDIKEANDTTEDEEEEDDKEEKKIYFQPYYQPGLELGNTMDVESEDSSDEWIVLYDSPELKTNVQNLATALLQVEQSIERKFFKHPFGVGRVTKDKALNLEKITKIAELKMAQWETSLMASTSYSQIFLHYLTLYDSIQWSQSATQASCQICKKRRDDMLLCDGCNKGFHLYCLKPKLKKIPVGDWFCTKCKPVEKVSRKRKVFTVEANEEKSDVEEEEEDEEEEETASGDTENESDNFSDDLCAICNIQGGKHISCYSCELQFHKKCCQHPPKPSEVDTWNCKKCAKNVKVVDCSDTDYYSDEKFSKKVNRVIKKFTKKAPKKIVHKKKRARNTSEDSEPPARKSRRENVTSSASSRQISEKDSSSDSDDQPIINVKNKRKSRQGELPLNSVALYQLLDDISKNENCWPFNRPVMKTEVPDYYDVIKFPMDFAKVKSRLNLGYYKTDYDIMNDIQLIFNNCDTYNNSDSEIYEAGVLLENFIMKKSLELNLPYRPSDMIADDEEEESKDVNPPKKRKVV